MLRSICPKCNTIFSCAHTSALHLPCMFCKTPTQPLDPRKAVR